MRRILVALDESPQATHVLESAIRMATALGAKLDLLRVAPIPIYPYPTGIYTISAELLPGVLEEGARRSLDEVALTVPVDLRAGAHVRLGTPWQQICEVATELDVELIILGSHGYQFIDRVLGTTAARVVNHADRSVLVIRAAEARKGSGS